MKYPIITDTIRRIQNDEGMTLDVRPWPDSPTNSVAIMNSDEWSEEWFGKIELPMDTQFARLLGEALIKCANEIEESKSNHE